MTNLLTHPCSISIRETLSQSGVTVALIERPWHENGIMWHFTADGPILVFIGLYLDSSARPFIVIETTLGAIPPSKMNPFQNYALETIYTCALPVRFCTRDEGYTHKSLLLNLRSPVHVLNGSYLNEIIEAMIGISQIERRNLLELGLLPFALPNGAA